MIVNEQGNELLKQTLFYTDTFNEFQVDEQIQEIRNYYIKMNGDVSERDYILIWNLMPANIEEAVALVPSLISAPQDTVVKMLAFLNEKKVTSRARQAM